MLVALYVLDLRIPGSASLKEKRHVLRSLTSGLRSKFNVSVAEVGHHDLWQRSQIAVSAVAGQGYHLRKVMHEVDRFVSRQPGVEVIDTDLTMHGPDD